MLCPGPLLFRVSPHPFVGAEMLERDVSSAYSVRLRAHSIMTFQDNQSMETQQRNHDQPPVRVRCVRTLEEVERLRPDWSRLQRHPNADIDFYLTILQARPEIEGPLVIVVERHNQPSMIVVGRMERRPFTVPLGYTEIQGPKARVLLVLYGGILGGDIAEDHKLALRQMHSLLQSGEIDLVFFNHLEVASSMYALATSATSLLCRARSLSGNPHHRLDLNRSYEDYQAALSKSTRKTLRRYRRRLEEDWGSRLSIQCIRDPRRLETILSDAEAIARKTYQRGLGVGFVANEEMRRRLRLELERGWLRAWFLYFDNRPVAYSFISCYHGVAFANETGYAPEHADLRIGHYLNERVIEELCAEPGIIAMDFGFGDAEYKRSICNQMWEERPVYLFAPTPRGVSMRLLHTVLGGLDSFGRQVIRRTRLLQILKRAWRRILTPNAPATPCFLICCGMECFHALCGA